MASRVKFGSMLFDDANGTVPYDKYDMPARDLYYYKADLDRWTINASDLRVADGTGAGCFFNVLQWDTTNLKWVWANGGFFGGTNDGALVGTRADHAMNTLGSSTGTDQDKTDFLRIRTYKDSGRRSNDESNVKTTGKMLYADGDGTNMVSDKGFSPLNSELALATCVPILESVHVYLNGIEQFQPQDWTLMPPDTTHATWWIQVMTEMDVRSGDLLEARYVCAPSARAEF